MNLPSQDFCVLPWISLEASPIGTVRPCCLAEEEIVDNDGNKFELRTADFNDIQNSDYMRDLRTDFLFGHRPETCRKCWAVEAAGGTSKRQHTLNRLKHIDMGMSWTPAAKPLRFLDLKLGNICNLKCRICGSWSSSQFATEELKFVEDKKSSFHYQMLRDGAWPRENQQFWNQIDNSLNDIRYLEFTGGEPFLIQEHFDMLQGIVDRGIAGNVEIHYNTNGTVYPEAAEAIWRHFKTVEIAFSIDDIGSRFEYQRTNAGWAEVCANLDRFRDLKEIHSNIQLQICTTVNVFNIYYLDHLAHWLSNNSESFNFIYWNLLHEIEYFAVNKLPESVKSVLTAHLNTADIPAEYQEEFTKIIGFMNSGESLDGSAMLAAMRQLDQRRNQNLAQVMPEWAAVIGYTKQ
jgi:MoaA/NifB/PqqE/SkfB family radical SAM enzyme